MSQQRKLSAALIAAALTVGLVACGGSDDDKADSGSGGAAGGGGGKKTTVKYLAQWNPQDPEAKVFDEAVKAFQAANPDIKVDISYSGKNADAKIVNQIKAGDAPDIVDGGTMRLKQFKLEPLDDLYAMQIPGEQKTVAEAIPAGLQELNKAEGKAYALPYEYVVGGLWYDQKSLDSRALTAPKTWDEFAGQAARFKQDKQPLAQQDGSVAGYNSFWLVDLVLRNGGDAALVKAATDKSGEGWKDPAIKKSAEQIRELVKSGAFNDGYEGTTFPAAQNSWAQGKGGYALNFSWMPKETDKVRNADFKVRYVPFPNTGGPGDNVVEADTTSFVIPEGAKHKAEAKKFLAFLYGKQHMQALSTTANTLTPRTDVTPPPLLADVTALLATNPKITPRLGNLERNTPNDYITKVIDPVYGDFFKSVGKQSADDFVNKIAKASKEYWEQQK